MGHLTGPPNAWDTLLLAGPMFRLEIIFPLLSIGTEATTDCSPAWRQSTARQLRRGSSPDTHISAPGSWKAGLA